MLNLTAEAKQAWLAQTRQVNARVTIGTTVYNADKIMSIEYDSGSISGETFQIGSFYQNSIKVVLVGILESLANDNKVKLEFAAKVGQAFEWVNMGTFYVTELDRDRNSNRTTFTAVDASVYIGKNYAPTISFPNSLKNLVTDIANQCGVQVNFASMTHLADVNVTQPPSKYTCRQVISMVAQIHGGFARINRNDQLEVTRLMSSDIELSPSHYLLKGLTKNETTYRTDGIIVKIGENEEDVLKVGTTTGSAVINLENPLMTQTLLDEMWRVVSIISYYPFNLKWRGIPNLEAGDWITIVDKQGTRYRVPNLSYKLSFKGGLSAESSANTTATSNVQHKLRGTLTQRVEDVEGYINASGGRSYTGLDVPDNEYLKKGDTWYKPDGDDTAILVYDGEKWEEVASPEVFRKLQADFDELDRQAKEAFEQVDTLVQESPETKRLAQEAQEAVNLANQEITKLQTSVSDTKTALENAEQEFADSLATTTRELTAKISGIDVGGRNILRGTKDMKLGSGNWADGTWRQYNTGTTKNITLTDFPLANITQGIEITSDNSECGIAQDYLKLESGEYTLSYYVKAKEPNTAVRIQAFWNAETGDLYKNITLTDTNWTRVSITSELKVNQDEISAGYIYVETPNSTIMVACAFEHRSNKEAEWSPAPEDFQSDLSNTSIELSTKITESAAKLRTEMSEKYSTKNDLTTLSGEYNSFKEETAKKFSQQVSSIQTIQTNTTEAQKLANDAYSKAQNAVASANSAVSTANTAKNNADKAIADVAALTKTVSSQSTRIDQTSGRIDLVASSVTEVGNRLDNLQVGGRNLLRHSDVGTENLKYFHTEYTTIEVVADGNIKAYKITADNTTNPKGVWCSFNDGIKNLLAGRTYTYSLWLKSSMVDNIAFDSIVHYQTRTGAEIHVTTNLVYNVDSIQANTWTKVYVTFYVTKDCFFVPYFWFLQSNQVIYVYDIMLEEGNTPSPWQPAPEDYNDKIDGINNNLTNNYYAKTTVDSKLSTAVSGITAQYTQDITTRLGNYYDKTTIDSKLTIDGQGIATYVKNTQSKLDNLQVGGRNLLLHSEVSEENMRYFEKQNATAEVVTEGSLKYYKIKINDGVSGNSNGIRIANNYGYYNLTKGKHYIFSYWIKTNVDYRFAFNSIGHHQVANGANIHTDINNKYNVSSLTANKWTRVTIEFDTTLDAFFIPYIWFVEAGMEICVYGFMLEEGNKASDWSPAPEDMATLTQYTEVKQLADRISSTVYDSASGLVTKTTQLAGKYAIQNLNSYGDVLSSLNLNGGNVRIKGGLIDLDGNVRIQDAFVTNLKANSILANEITAKATTVVNAKIANLDAGVITTGILKGTNLSLNLGTGEVQFKKGRIQAPNNTLDIQVNTGIMKVLNTNGEGVTFQNGNLYFSNTSVQGYYGSIKYNQDFGGPVKGVKIDGYGGVILASRSQKDTLFNGYLSDIKNGSSLSLEELSDGTGYAYLLSRDSITIAVNKKIQDNLGYSHFTGIQIDKTIGTLTLASEDIRLVGDDISLNNKHLLVYSDSVTFGNTTKTSFTGPVSFNAATNFYKPVNFSDYVNGKRLAYGKSMDITFELKNAYTSSAYLEVTQGTATYKIPLKA